jgi:hypothetical protein
MMCPFFTEFIYIMKWHIMMCPFFTEFIYIIKGHYDVPLHLPNIINSLSDQVFIPLR